MDEALRRILRQVDDANPNSFLPAARALERAGASALVCSDLLEKLLRLNDAIYWRGPGLNTSEHTGFTIAWSWQGKERRGFRFCVQDGGMLFIYPGKAGLRVTIPDWEIGPTFSVLLQLIVVNKRLAPPTSQFVEILRAGFARHQVVSADQVDEGMVARAYEPGQTPYYIGKCSFDVVARQNPAKDWQREFNLHFNLRRSFYADLLEVSIEDNLNWGSEHEIQGMRLTGTAFTVYGNQDPEEGEEDQEHPYGNYEPIVSLQAFPALIDEVFERFRGI